uniref:Glutathione S-transferase n=1 Tax=Panagrolaimus sp. JU765 TaxID=591449 RepID=A0AC34RSS1_9BILA
MGYKLYYFDVRYYAEPIRLMLTAAGKDFEEINWTMDEWLAGKKKESPTGKAPWLEVDGRVIPESFAIYRFLANRYGFAGKDEFEKARVDWSADFFRETTFPSWEFFRVKAGRLPGDPDKIYQEKALPALKTAYDQVQKLLEESGSGFIVPSGLTWADLYLAENVRHANAMDDNFAGMFPFAIEYEKRVRSHPSIKDYCETRKNLRTSYCTVPGK